MNLPPPFVDRITYSPTKIDQPNYSSVQGMGNSQENFNRMQPPQTSRYHHGSPNLRFPSQGMTVQITRPPIQQSNSFSSGLHPRFGQVPLQNQRYPMDNFGQQQSHFNQASNPMPIHPPMFSYQNSSVQEHRVNEQLPLNQTSTCTSSFQENSTRANNFQSHVNNTGIVESNVDQNCQRKEREDQWLKQWLQKIGKSKTEKPLESKNCMQKYLKVSVSINVQSHVFKKKGYMKYIKRIL